MDIITQASVVAEAQTTRALIDSKIMMLDNKLSTKLASLDAKIANLPTTVLIDNHHAATQAAIRDASAAINLNHNARFDAVIAAIADKSAIKSIQRGFVYTELAAATMTIALAEINVSKSVVEIIENNADYKVGLRELKSTSLTLSASKPFTGSYNYILAWQVVEYY